MVGLAVFLFCALLLVAGYAVYGRLAERVYGVSHSMTMPCEQRADGVDYVRMPTWRVFLVQLLNIAGLGPVFGALAGCLYGPWRWCGLWWDVSSWGLCMIFWRL